MSSKVQKGRTKQVDSNQEIQKLSTTQKSIIINQHPNRREPNQSIKYTFLQETLLPSLVITHVITVTKSRSAQHLAQWQTACIHPVAIIVIYIVQTEHWTNSSSSQLIYIGQVANRSEPEPAPLSRSDGVELAIYRHNFHVRLR